MKLLADKRSAGASNDYLYARIRCRRAGLVMRFPFGGRDSGDPQSIFEGELNWVYCQLNVGLRAFLRPFFEYFELRRLVVALRYLAAGDLLTMNAELQQGLLSPDLCKLMSEAESVSAAVAGLDRLLTAEYPCFSDLATIYLRQGPGGLEQNMLGRFLQLSSSKAQSRQVRSFLQFQLDQRNLLAVYKHLRWQVALPPPLLSGGAIGPADLLQLWEEEDLPGLLLMVARRAESRQIPAENDIEDVLLDGLTARLKKEGREPLQPGLVIDYLWRCYMLARQRGLEISAQHRISALEATG